MICKFLSILTFSWPSHSALHLETWWSIGTQKGIKGISRHGTLLLRESEQGFFSWNFVKAILTQEPSRAGFQGLPEHPRLPGHPGPSRVSQPTQTHPGLPLASQNFQGPPRASQGVRGTTRTFQSFPGNSI